MAKRRKVVMPKPELNITSMMDLVLNLLTFFVLVSNFAMAELPSLQPPNPKNSKAKPTESPDKVTVNIIPNLSSPGEALAVKVGNTEIAPSDLQALTQLLQVEKQKSENVAIDLRADRSLRYDQVQPVMGAITSAGIRRVNVVVEINE